MRYGKKSDLALPNNGTAWFGCQQSLNDVISTQLRLEEMDTLKLADMQVRAVEMRQTMASAEDNFANHYMIDTYHDGALAVVSIQGGLLHHPMPLRMFGLPVTTYGEIQDAMMRLAGDPKVERIMMAFGSGGGSGHGLFRTSNLIERVSKLKQVDTFTDTNMGSAAYWLGVLGKKIYAEPMASVGSIGVYMTMVSNFEKNRQEGREVKIVRAGEFKALGLSDEQITDKAVATWQESVNKAYDEFLDHASSHRGVNRETFRVNAAEGRVFSGQDAVQAGLVDELLVYDDVIEKLKPSTKSKTAPLNVAGRQMSEGDMNKKQLELLQKLGISLSAEQHALLASGVGYDKLGLEANIVSQLAQLDTAENNAEGGNDKAPTVLTEKQLKCLEDNKVSLSDEQKSKLQAGDKIEDIGLEATVLEKVLSADKAPVVEPPQNGGNLMELVGQITQLSSELATAKLALANAEAKLETATTQSESFKGQLDILRGVAMSSINRLELGMRTSVTVGMEGMTTEKLVELHGQVKERFESVYPTGQRTTTAVQQPIAGRTSAMPADLEAAVANATTI